LILANIEQIFVVVVVVIDVVHFAFARVYATLHIVDVQCFYHCNNNSGCAQNYKGAKTVT